MARMTTHEQKKALIFMLSCIDFDSIALLSKNPELVERALQHAWPANSGVTELIARAQSAAALQSIRKIKK